MVSQWQGWKHDRGTVEKRSVGIGVVLATAIAAPMLISSVARAQQALPPPPSISNGAALPSLAPVPPPSMVPMVPPTGLSPLPQESFYPTPAPMPGMVPPAGLSPQGVMPQMRTSYYQVVVPTPPENFMTIANKMMAMGVRPDAIQARKAPLGPHLAVGPFVQVGEAESVSNYLRSGGMDARVFYQR